MSLTRPTDAEPCFTASMAYSTWYSRPCGLHVMTSVSYWFLFWIHQARSRKIPRQARHNVQAAIGRHRSRKRTMRTSVCCSLLTVGPVFPAAPPCHAQDCNGLARVLRDAKGACLDLDCVVKCCGLDCSVAPLWSLRNHSHVRGIDTNGLSTSRSCCVPTCHHCPPPSRS